MGFLDALTSFFDAHADEPQKEEPEEEEQEESKSKDNEENDEAGDAEESDDGAEDSADEEEEEEEEDEEEPVDPRGKIEEECEASASCKHHKHEYEACVSRVTRQIENDGGAKEDCVEEFFELTHCVQNCVAPKLFKQLK